MLYIAMRKRLEEREEGFTLIELLVVVIIIGILAAIAIPVFLNQRERGWIASAESDVRNAAIEVETFYTANSNVYPATFADFSADVQVSTGVADNAGTADALTYTVSADGQSYCLGANHTNIDSGATPSALYRSDLGGLQDTAAACPANGF